MSRTTDQWAALLDGTSPTPWVANPHGNIFASVDGRTPDMDAPLDPTRETVIGKFLAWHVDRDVLDPANSRLAAAAPEAVEEVWRLRWELETWRMRIEKDRDAFKNSRHANRCDKLIATINRILDQEKS